MERNLDRRVEVLCPVLDPELTAYLRDVVLDAYLRDSQCAYVLDAEGTYRRAPREGAGVDAQQRLLTRHVTEYSRDERTSIGEWPGRDSEQGAIFTWGWTRNCSLPRQGSP